LIQKYMGSVVPSNDNYFAALNSAVFSDGSFCYIPKGVRCPMELSTYFRINAANTGQFERTLIVAEEGSYVSYLEGCTAPMRDENQLHAAVVELVAMENAQLHTKTRELSVRDELTALYNRRHFQEVLQMEWKRATRFKRPLSLLMIDIDHFKIFNDTFGHLTGDKVLKTISKLLIKNLREVDTIARFGGEEFVVLLPDTDVEGAQVVGEKIRRIVEGERLSEDRHIMPLTISIGISNFPKDAREMDDLIDHSDVVLYEAKDRGRNQVVTYIEFAEDLNNPSNHPIVTN